MEISQSTIMADKSGSTKYHRDIKIQLKTQTDLARDSCSKRPKYHHHQAQQHSRKRKRSLCEILPTLPFNSKPLAKDHFNEYKPIFGLYLDIQKNKIFEELDVKEVKGRWKSFMHKWNRGELSEGWYDPSTKQKAYEKAIIKYSQTVEEVPEIVPKRQNGTDSCSDIESNDGNQSDQSFGPMLPGQEMRSKSRKLGPTIPSIQDIQLIRENAADARIARYNEEKMAQKADLNEQKAILDELIPQSMAGTRERKLEKKRDLNEKRKSFREKSPGTVDIPDSDLLGDRNDFELYQKAKREMERKKNERELRKEAFLRVRVAEREERLRKYREKEEATIGMFKALAKERFG